MHPRLLPLLCLLGLAATLRAEDTVRPATVDEIVLFKEAMRNTKQDTEHWAYTETTVMKASKGRERGETIVRFDPSKPYVEQYTPLKIEGKPPSERQLKKYRERGEKRGERITRAAAAATDPSLAARPPVPQMRLGGTKLTVDLEHPQVAAEEPDRLIYAVPLIGTSKDVPVDKFEVHLVVGKAARQVEQVRLTIRESFRVKVIAKIKAGEVTMNFAIIDPKYGPVITSTTGNIGASVLFLPVNATFTNTRTEWQRVKPYNERLQVKLGPLELLDF